jgi:hypothetical protein
LEQKSQNEIGDLRTKLQKEQTEVKVLRIELKNAEDKMKILESDKGITNTSFAVEIEKIEKKTKSA